MKRGRRWQTRALWITRLKEKKCVLHFCNESADLNRRVSNCENGEKRKSVYLTFVTAP